MELSCMYCHEQCARVILWVIFAIAVLEMVPVMPHQEISRGSTCKGVLNI
jgi:hypothetical protein